MWLRIQNNIYVRYFNLHEDSFQNNKLPYRLSRNAKLNLFFFKILETPLQTSLYTLGISIEIWNVENFPTFIPVLDFYDWIESTPHSFEEEYVLRVFTHLYVVDLKVCYVRNNEYGELYNMTFIELFIFKIKVVSVRKHAEWRFKKTWFSVAM